MEYMYRVDEQVVLSSIGIEKWGIDQSNGGEGSIIALESLNGEPWYVVTWENNATYSYPESDICYPVDAEEESEGEEATGDEWLDAGEGDEIDVSRMLESAIFGQVLPTPPAPTAPQLLNVGDRVRMTQAGIDQWTDQAGGSTGTIVERTNYSDFVYKVNWDKRGFKASYRIQDIELAPHVFQPGDRVRLNEFGLSKFKSQSGGGLGTFIGLHHVQPDWFSVDWDNGKKNSYKLDMLELVSAGNPAPKRKKVRFLDYSGFSICARNMEAGLTDEQINAKAEKILIEEGIKGCVKFSIVEA